MMPPQSLPFRPDQDAVYSVAADGSDLKHWMLEGNFISMAISPGSRWLAVTVNHPDRTADLALIDVTSNSWETVQHVDGALYAGSWSPDGEWLALSHQDDTSGTVQMYSRSTGQLTAVADGYAYGGQWTADSASYFTGTNDPMNVRRISLPDLGSHAIDVPENFDRLAVSPDGEQIAVGSWLYGATSSNVNPYVIALAEPDGSQHRELARLPDNSFVLGEMAWSPDGTRLGYGWAGIIQDAPPGTPGLDSGVFVIDVVTGDTTRVSDTDRGVDMRFSWSPDGERMIIHRGVCTQCDGPGSKELLAAADGSGVIDLPGTEQFQFSDGSWSPDGQRFAYSGDRLYVADADGSNAEAIVDLPSSAYEQIEWSEDSERLFFVRSAALGNSLYAFRHDGSSIDALEAPPDLGQIAVAPDGKTYAGVGQGGRITILQPDGTRVEVLGDGLDDLDVNQAYSAAFAWSPDGGSVAIELGEKGETLAIADLSGAARLIEAPNKGGPVRWSPDSTQLAYWADGVIRAVGADGGTPRPIVEADVVAFDWSPDGSELAFVQDGQVVRAPSDGSQSARLLFPAAVGGLGTIAVRWSPDGDRIAAAGGSNLLVGRANGGGADEVASLGTLDAFAWAVDGQSLVYSGVVDPSLSGDSGVFVVGVEGGSPVHLVESHTRFLRLLGPLADGRFVISSEFRL